MDVLLASFSVSLAQIALASLSSAGRVRQSAVVGVGYVGETRISSTCE